MLFTGRMKLIVLPAVLCARTAFAQPPQWSNLTPTENVYYVSTSGADTNPGTIGAPFRTLSRGYSALRDGHADWLLLKSGDTWNESFPSTFTKSARSTSAYMVIGSYGFGVRPRLRVGSPVVYGGTAGGFGLAILDLDVAPVAPGSGYAAFTFFQPWRHLLIEGCSIVGFPVNIVCQETGAGRLSDIRVRFCVVADSVETGPGHSQGVFFGSVDNWVIEGCVLDLNATEKRDMFCHNVYVHQTCGSGDFSYNISARACSHGFQQRPGGTTIGNLLLQNPINAYTSGGIIRDNVALDSRDINGTDVRGFGFAIGGNSLIERNVAAHQRSGTGNVTAFDLDGGSTLRDNIVYDWTYNAAGWGTAYQWEGGGTAAVFQGNRAYQPSHGMCIREAGCGGVWAQNRYWSTNPAGGYEQFSRCGFAGSWAGYAGSEAGSTFGNPGAFDVSIPAYMASLGRTGGLPEFMAEARQLSRSNFRVEFTAAGVNPWVRSRFGLGPPPCYADQDGNGVLNANDFQAFANSFAVGAASANCDGSTVEPAENANDFQCFLNAFAVGCP